MNWIGVAGASLMAATISLIELGNARRKPMAFKSVHWILLRLAFDSATAMLAYAVLTDAVNDPEWSAGFWPIVTAGLVGPAVLRSELALLKPGNAGGTVGIATVYKKVQIAVDGAIDDICSVEQARWIEHVALPALATASIREIEQRACTYLSSLDRLSTRRRSEQIDFIRKVACDTSSASDDRLRSILQHLIDNGGRRLVKSLVRHHKSNAPPNSGQHSPESIDSPDSAANRGSVT